MPTVKTAELTLTIDEIRSKLGSARARPEKADVEWQVSLALATGGPLFTSRGSDLFLVAPKNLRSGVGIVIPRVNRLT